MSLRQAWPTLGIARTADAGAIRRAYAERLKALDVDQDVEGYARLREARDMALAWARRQPAPPEADPLPAEAVAVPEPAPIAAWAYAAPLFESTAQAAVVTALPMGAAGYAPWPVACLARRAETGAGMSAGTPFAAPLLTGRDAASELVQPDGGRDVALYDMLLGEGSDEDEPMDAAEQVRALGHLRVVLRQAETGDLARHDSIEQWLAEILARAWPRSAPLLAPAAASFGWEAEVGRLGERRAIAFLVARLRGLRFQERVLDPGHQFHRAWKELSRPGPAGVLKRLRVGGEEVRGLLAGVRKHFPELEQHLDPQRVQSWESAPRFEFRASAWGWGVFLVLQVLIAIARLSGDGGTIEPPSPPPVLSGNTADPIDAKLLDDTAADLFGAGMTLPQVAKAQPELAETIRSNLYVSRRNSDGDDSFRRSVADLVRGRVYEGGQAAGGTDLEAAMRLRLAYLKSLQAIAPGACMALYRTGRLDPRVSLPAEVHAREQKLAAALLRQGRLALPRPRGDGKARVPGAIIARVRTATGLPPARITRALANEGSDADRCAVTTALLAATLEWHGQEREPILRLL